MQHAHDNGNDIITNGGQLKKTSDTFNTNIVLLQGLDYFFFLFDHRWLLIGPSITVSLPSCLPVFGFRLD